MQFTLKTPGLKLKVSDISALSIHNKRSQMFLLMSFYEKCQTTILIFVEGASVNSNKSKWWNDEMMEKNQQDKL